jgi:hypothetical protein
MRKTLHAGVLAENTTSALSRVVMTDGLLRLSARYPISLTVHDEIVCIVPDAEVAEACVWVQAQMLKEPPCMPGIPIDAVTGHHQRYGLAKG